MATRCIFIAGPTAVGKSEIAAALAEKIGGEIISVDSMQVYRGLDIGTAKPDRAVQSRIRHHLIDVCDLTEPFNASQFVRLANVAVADIVSRGRTPIFCGGTGLYFNAFLDGLGNGPATEPALRAQLETEPAEKLLEELRERDPKTYETIDRKNPRRVIRALEVIRLTGKPFSGLRANWGADEGGLGGQAPVEGRFFLLTRLSGDLRRRIDGRVEEMFVRGLVAETQDLLKHGLETNRTAMQAIGYRQVVEHLRGERELGATIELIKVRTRQFAKRQLTWFRRYGKGERIELKPEETAEEVLERLALAMRRT